MKKFNKRLIWLSISFALLLGMVGIVFAAYSFTKSISMENDVGDIYHVKQYYLNYSNPVPSNPTDETRQAKLRRDTVIVLDGITLKYDSSYVETEDEYFLSGKTYYKDSTGTVAEVDVDTEIVGTYYEEVRTYTGIKTISLVYDIDFNTDYTPTYSESSKVIKVTVDGVEITITTTLEDAVISSATVSATGKNYRVVIDSDGLGLSVLDSDITSICYDDVVTETTTTTTTTTEDVIYGYTKQEASSKITCSATDSKYNSSNIYLSQLGLQFSFESDIAVYVRIHIQDAWKRTRVYSSNTKILYILKDQISGTSPFAVSSDDWYYDVENNIAYLKTMYDPKEATNDIQSYTFNVNEAYFYQQNTTNTYSEYVDVEVSFTVDIVQANRVKAVWGVDPATLG